MPKRSRTDTPTASEISRIMSLIGSKGGKIGGKQRATNMTKEERSRSASQAAKARWAKKETVK
ncbi:MAG TPA: hypothetical protein VI685_02125 [Candidatus Angelobacter sp.]